MDMAFRDPEKVQEGPGDHHHALTSHISPAVLPPSVQTVVGKRETSVLDHVMMGEVHESCIEMKVKGEKIVGDMRWDEVRPLPTKVSEGKFDAGGLNRGRKKERPTREKGFGARKQSFRYLYLRRTFSRVLCHRPSRSDANMHVGWMSISRAVIMIQN